MIIHYAITSSFKTSSLQKYNTVVVSAMTQ